ncbi:MAG: redoxin family protein [Bacteroidales bacterium]|jgi:thiol-disulfide isomerase/thioredoxin|nr:redoxin family protein [Bacteroidales bacterium]MDD4671472.1 redoxin family protein [Bacteroidales bacterium]MDY0347902.1 redoxin family protein [Tenuifilaceae bacterium]
MPISPYSFDNSSIYEIWVDKTTDLPYKVRREMSHNISVTICKDIRLNQLDINSFKLNDYFPEHYQIVPYGKGSTRPKTDRLTGKPAPHWVLESSADTTISIKQLKSKVLLIQFTSVSCGPCRASVDFMKEVNESYSKEDVDVVAIECSSKNLNVLKTYSKRSNFDYKFLLSTRAVKADYSISSFPVFFIIDQERIVQKVVNGYAKGQTDKEIREIIESLI